MARILNDEYKELNLQKNECNECNKQFITGLEISEKQGMICPYCGSKNTGWVSCTDNENLDEMDLGCLSIIVEI